MQILKYDVIGEVAACGAEVPSPPEMPSPVPLAQFGELHLYPVGRPPLDPPDEAADRDVRGDLDEHAHMLLRQNAGHDRLAEFAAHPPDDFADTFSQRSFQHLVAVFRDPDDVVTVVKDGVTSAGVARRMAP